MKYIDGWFWCRYTLNPFAGCEHACIYCDARSQKYYQHDDFEETIYVKEDIDKILNKQLRTMQKDVIAMAGVCDAYQQAEKEYQNTRKCLKAIDRFGFPVNISTKSDLVLRDIDLLSSIADKSWCSIAFTITTLDKEIETFLEPGASPSKSRFEAIKTIKNQNTKIRVGVNFMPIVPFLEDSNENLEKIICACKESSADYVHFAPGMTLRDNQRYFFLDKLQNQYPELVPKINALFGGQMHPNSEYLQRINKQLVNLCQKFLVNMRLKRWIPKDFRRINYRVAEKLLNESYLNQINGKPYSKLLWAGLSINNLKKSIMEYYNTGTLLEVENITPKIIQKIQPFLKQKGSLQDYF